MRDFDPGNIAAEAFTKGGKYIIMEASNSNGGVLVGWVENKIERTRMYNKENYEQIKMQVPKGTKAVIKAAAERAGKSMTAYIMEAVNERLAKDK